MYDLPGEGRTLDPAAMIEYYGRLADRFPLVSIEDGLDENAWDDWRRLTDALGDRVQLVGDDLFVTNVDFLRRGIEEGVANAILVKVNQIGTLTETARRDRARARRGLRDRDLPPFGRDRGHDDRRPRGRRERGPDQDRRAVAHDRVAKYNQLLRIEEELGDEAVYPGWAAFRRR